MNSLMAVSVHESILIASGDSEGSALFGLVLFLSPFIVAFFVYTAMYKRYRNQDKRYQFEVTTSAVRSSLQRWDTFSRKRNGQSNSKISGKNDHKPLEKLSHSVVREAQTPREAQEGRQAQEAREAQAARDAQEGRDAQAERGDPQSPTAQPGQP